MTVWTDSNGIEFALVHSVRGTDPQRDWHFNILHLATPDQPLPTDGHTIDRHWLSNQFRTDPTSNDGGTRHGANLTEAIDSTLPHEVRHYTTSPH